MMSSKESIEPIKITGGERFYLLQRELHSITQEFYILIGFIPLLIAILEVFDLVSLLNLFIFFSDPNLIKDNSETLISPTSVIFSVTFYFIVILLYLYIFLNISPYREKIQKELNSYNIIEFKSTWENLKLRNILAVILTISILYLVYIIEHTNYNKVFIKKNIYWPVKNCNFKNAILLNNNDILNEKIVQLDNKIYKCTKNISNNPNIDTFTTYIHNGEKYIPLFTEKQVK